MSDKINREYFAPGAAAFNYNVTGGADSASGGSGGSGMECLQLRSPPHPSFHYLISEQAKSLVALQNEVGALLEFRDLVIETFPNLRSKMAPSTPAVARRDWEPGVRVRRKLAGGGGDAARAKPQPSVQDSGFSTETSCGKDAHSSASASAPASRPRPLEDELWALLDVIQRKGGRLRDEAELLRGELDERQAETAEESFARQLSAGCAACTDVARLRGERDALLAQAAQLEAQATANSHPRTPLGRLDGLLDTPPRPPTVASPDRRKFAAILQESNPVELQRQLLVSIVQNQVYSEQLKHTTEQRTLLLDKLKRVREDNEDLKFRLEEKTIELEGARARLRQVEGRRDSPERHSMRDLEPLHLPDDEARLGDTPRRRPSRIPRHTAHKGAAPRPPGPASGAAGAPRPPSAGSVRSVRSARSAASVRVRPDKPAPPRHAPDKNQEAHIEIGSEADRYRDSLSIDSRKLEAGAQLVVEYLARTDRLAPLFPKLHTVRTRPLPDNLLQDCRLAYETPQNLALELSKSILYENADSIDLRTLKSLNSHGDASLWDGKPQQYFESMNEGNFGAKEFDDDSLAS
ncbi:uncharacterized protein LOC119834596 isoform X2 [Zerene cesonia]|uniref:uncharacterized protein LOC119834596 isoform X2 n=1 Tax=Zerene cesonia TaxID=33412 RepID=UPI0018E4DF4E|nr:uncharacterized protein LOC119834596 isoform X2 [Zerene cesonia]